MDARQIVIICLIVIVSLFLINEARFLVWGAYGFPEEANRPNCGESRYKYDVKINSKQEFMDLIESWQNVSSSEVGQEAFFVIQWFKFHPMLTDRPYNVNDVTVRESASLLFREKIYTVKLQSSNSADWPCNLDLEISENGLIAVRGCCGI